MITNERVENLQQNLETQISVKDEIKAMVDAGFVEDTDYDQLSILVNNLSLSVATLKQQEEIFYNQLKLMLKTTASAFLKIFLVSLATMLYCIYYSFSLQTLIPFESKANTWRVL